MVQSVALVPRRNSSTYFYVAKLRCKHIAEAGLHWQQPCWFFACRLL